MTLSYYSLRPSVRSLLLSFFVHHNPFYLLSALSMLSACYALNSTLDTRAGDLGRLIALIGTLNVYEALLIALGLYLIHRRGIVRDGRTLLLLQATFLVDLAFLNAEAGSVAWGIGLALDGMVLGLALMKVAVVMRWLWPRFPRPTFALVAAELSALLLLPSAFKWFEHRGTVTEAQFYGAWWLIGLLLAAIELQRRYLSSDDERAQTALQQFIGRLYLALPIASLVLHLSMLHWVYRVRFSAGELSGVLIGLAFVLGRSSEARRRDFVLLRALLPAAAVALAWQYPPLVHLRLAGAAVTPAHAALAAAYLSYLYCFFLPQANWLVPAGAAAAVVAMFGPTLAQVSSAVAWLAQQCIDVCGRLFPRSAVQWGLLALASAFAFLGLGFATSLRKERAEDPPNQARLD